MSLYGENIRVNGLTCGIVRRGAANGEYELVFEREYAGPQQLEAIDWSRPEIRGESLLPAGYGYELADIRYRHGDKAYAVTLRVAGQYLGDVTGYQEQVTALEQQLAEIEEAYDNGQ